MLGLLPDNTLKLARAGGDGRIGEPLAIPEGVATELVAITSVGVTFVEGVEGGTATTLAWTGEPGWRPSPARRPSSSTPSATGW